MFFRLHNIVLILSLFAFLACEVQKPDENNRLVEFKNRKIDLKPYIEGFPYSGFSPFFEAGKLYYYHQDTTTMLKSVDLGNDADFSTGTLVSDIDFSKRNVWGTRYHADDKNLYWTGDEKNDEVINLYQLNPATKAIKKLTDVPYIYGWRWDKSKKQVAYVARLGDKEKRLSELRVLDLGSLQEKVIMQDTPEYRFTWGSPSWQPAGKGVVIPVVKNADRSFGNLVYVDLKTKIWSIITNPQQARSWPYAMRDWLSDNEFIYTSNEDGFNNLYSYNIKRKETQQLTKFKKDLSQAEMVTIDGKRYIFAILDNPIESEILLIDPNSSNIVNQQKVNANLRILDTKDRKLLVSVTSATVKFRIDELQIEKSAFNFKTNIDLPVELKKQIQHARQERIEYPTFDIDPKTGKKRLLHAFLYHPEKPLPKDQQIVMIQSFYGGGNFFSTRTHILAEAGIYVLSPSPRGSSGFGREFSALNDKDLGGNEIIDVIYAAQYISEKLGIPPSRVGVYGGSHGGYATMRCLTFPGEINGNKASFDWGFGISHAGFSDIVHFYENCNIPDWVTLEAGDPKTEAAKLRDRSPLYHADKMVGKLLLTHGTNDSRVPIEGSRWMADSLRVYNKDVSLIEFEGQGHGIKGLENSIRFYNVWFDFLDTIN
ncbi:MAG: S9 family peptidase [Calditrichaeota bacterium]|nr:MAG: S9 family peptidase [Calditrichota bacterium]